MATHLTTEPNAGTRTNHVVQNTLSPGPCDADTEERVVREGTAYKGRPPFRDIRRHLP